MATIMITGGTGLIGSALTEHLIRASHEVIVLTRDVSKHAARKGVQFAAWDIQAGSLDTDALQRADHIVHLAGANVAEKRWTNRRKQEIVYSRVQSGALLVNALKAHPNKVQSVVSASAIGWYGPDPQVPNPRPFVETDPVSNDFLGNTCAAWEAAIAPVRDLGKRLVYLRTGIVLSNEGGAYAEFKKPLKFGLATVMGSGKQVVSWIHIDDLVNMYTAALFDSRWQGVYNAVAPSPVSNAELVTTMAKRRKKFFIKAPVPSLALNLALGQMSIEVLKSATVSAEKVVAEGYNFRYPTIAQAVEQLSS